MYVYIYVCVCVCVCVCVSVCMCTVFYNAVLIATVPYIASHLLSVLQLSVTYIFIVTFRSATIC